MNLSADSHKAKLLVYKFVIIRVEIQKSWNVVEEICVDLDAHFGGKREKVEWRCRHSALRLIERYERDVDGKVGETEFVHVLVGDGIRRRGVRRCLARGRHHDAY
jgi:hypothetical protein